MSTDDISPESIKCGVCNEHIEKDSSERVICEQCNTHFHKPCVLVNENVKVWKCKKCPPSNVNQQFLAPGAPTASRSRSVTSRVSSNSSQMEAALKLFDEQEKALKQQAAETAKLLELKEKSMKEQHDKQNELMEKKLQFIKELSIADNKSRSSRSSTSKSLTSQEKVSNWMQGFGEIDGNVDSKINQTAHTKKQTDAERLVNNLEPTKIVQPNVQHLNFQNQPNSTKVAAAQKNRAISQPTFNVPTSSTIEPQPNSELVSLLSKQQIASRHVVKELPSFDGSPGNWSSFISSYNRSTRLCGFSNDENLERLKRALKGSAHEAVKNSLNLDVNVPKVIATLKMLFGRPEFVIDELLEQLRKDSRPKSESIESIIKYALQVETIADTMIAGGMSEYLWNPQLLREIVEKLPIIQKNEWAKCKPERACSIEEFSAWLSDVANKLASILPRAPVFNKGSESQSKKAFLNVHFSNKCYACSGSCPDLSECDSFLKMDLKNKWIIIQGQRVCRTCLKRHSGKMCRIDKLCGVDGCERRHHSVLHRAENKKEEGVNLHREDNRILYKILPVTLHGDGKYVDTFAMLDDGSSLTLMEDSLRQELNLSGTTESLCLRWTGDVQRTETSSRRVGLQISSSGLGKPKFLIQARTVTCLNLPSQTVNMKYLASQYPYLKDVPIKSYENVQPRILIGIDYPKLTLISSFQCGAEQEPIAGRCKIGWVIFGAQSHQTASIYHVSKCTCNPEDTSKLDDLIKHYYTLESIGISAPNVLPKSPADERALQIINKTKKYFEGRFEIGLLWKFDNLQIPPSFNMALNRLKCLEKQCIKTPGLREIIDDQIEQYVRKGYARKATALDMKVNEHWYLPIFVVKNPNKPGKVRLVWDAAATTNTVSLNSMLLKGFDNFVSLPGILQRFRERKIAVTGDIKEMYHQVKISPEDQQFQRFLWRSSPKEDPVVYIMQVMTFGATCSPSCAQFIKDFNADLYEDTYPQAVECIKINHYVDDMLDSVDTVEEATKLCNEVTFIHQKGGFHIRNWATNSEEVRNALIGVSERSEVMMTTDDPLTNKILGMWWSTTKDSFFYSLHLTKANAEILNGTAIPTKREVLRLIMSIFDPLGLLCHRMAYGKILMQKVWRHRISWDDKIPEELRENWLIWIKALKEIEQIEIPRWYGVSSNVHGIELHTFCDASEDSYSSVVYLRLISETDIKCVLVTAKSKVAPLKMISIPRLELQAAVLGSRLAATVSKQHRLDITRRFFWTDSQTVLSWIHSDHKRYKQFVACRIGELLESTKEEEWNWVGSKNNVADLATKMRLPNQSQENNWFFGPEFLHEPMESWPKNKVDPSPTEELRPQYHFHVHEESEVIHVQNFSSWRKLRRVLGFVLRYVNNFISKHLKIKGRNPIVGPLTKLEYQKSETALFKIAQKSCYFEEIELLSTNGRLGKRSPIYKDLPYLDDVGVLRAKGRIDLANGAPESLKRPILLPRKHGVSQLIIQHFHQKFVHKNHETAINELRQRFAIPQLRRQFNSVVKACQYCKNLGAKAVVPIMAELPAARVTTVSRPFTYMGIDYFGPITVTLRRKSEKRWGVLITCLTTRAVHLEMAYSLSSASCIICIRNCINRRGKPQIIYSDNGTNFKGASRELQEAVAAIDKTAMAEYFTDADTDWSFIPPASPHMGGAWERMVRSVKTTLSAILHNVSLNDEVLNSSLIEVENIINSRPLTYVPVSSDIEEALTPNHLLLGSSNGIKPLCEFEDRGYIHRQNWKKVQHVADLFWKRWNLEYLPTLTRRTKWFEPQKPIELGDVVVIVGGDQPRNVWPKGRVIQLHPSRDGNIRSVTLQTVQGIYKRPVSKLAVLDVLRNAEFGTSQTLCEIQGDGVANSKELTQENQQQNENLNPSN